MSGCLPRCHFNLPTHENVYVQIQIHLLNARSPTFHLPLYNKILFSLHSPPTYISHSSHVFLLPFLTPSTLPRPTSLNFIHSTTNINYNINYNMASKHPRKEPVPDRNKRVKITDEMIGESLRKPRFMPPYFPHEPLDPNLYAGGM